MKSLSDLTQNPLLDEINAVCDGYIVGGKTFMLETPMTVQEIGCQYCAGLKMYSCLLNDGSENSQKRVAFCADPSCPRPRQDVTKTASQTAMEWTKLGFPETHKGKNIKNYRFAYIEGLESCKKFLADKTWNVWFFGGSTGAGKTHLAQALAIQNYYTYGKAPLFVKASTFYYEMQQARKNNEEWKILHRYATAEFLILDDLGASRNTKYEVDILYDLLSRRIEAGLKTIVTSNLSKDQVYSEEFLGARFQQRMSNYGKWQNFYKPGEIESNPKIKSIEEGRLNDLQSTNASTSISNQQPKTKIDPRPFM